MRAPRWTAASSSRLIYLYALSDGVAIKNHSRESVRIWKFYVIEQTQIVVPERGESMTHAVCGDDACFEVIVSTNVGSEPRFGGKNEEISREWKVGKRERGESWD